MKLERNCQLRSEWDVECGSALWKNHNWRKYNCCHSVMWPRSFAGQWWSYKSTKVAQETLVAPFTDTVSSLFCWTIPPALIYSHDVGSCLDSPSRLSSGEQGNKAKQCVLCFVACLVLAEKWSSVGGWSLLVIAGPLQAELVINIAIKWDQKRRKSNINK